MLKAHKTQATGFSVIPVIAAINTDSKIAWLPQFNSGIGGMRNNVWLNSLVYKSTADGSIILRAGNQPREYNGEDGDKVTFKIKNTSQF